MMQIIFVWTEESYCIPHLSFIALSALCLLQTPLHSIVRQAEEALMESEPINMEGSVEVTLAPN